MASDDNRAENTTTDPAPAIRTHGLTKSYGKARGIVDLDLAIPHGEVFGYLGPNGAGKTTTIRLLLDFLVRPPARRRCSDSTPARTASRSGVRLAIFPAS